MTDDGWCVMDDGWWMMDDAWWMTDDGWWMMRDGWWMMDDGWWMMGAMIDDSRTLLYWNLTLLIIHPYPQSSIIHHPSSTPTLNHPSSIIHHPPVCCNLGILSPFSLYFNLKLIVTGQVWRLATNFMFFGDFGLDFCFHMFFLSRFGGGGWMMDDGWWMVDDEWWMMDDGWWMKRGEWMIRLYK